MTQRSKLLVFSRLDYSRLNGGVLCSSNFLQNLQQMPDTDLIFVSCEHANVEAANRRFAASLGLKHYFIPSRETTALDRNIALGLRSPATRDFNVLLEKYYWFFERFYRNQRHVDAALGQIVERERPDLIIVDGIWSALCIPAHFAGDIPCCFITHNHEVHMHEDIRSHAQFGPTGSDLRSKIERWIAQRGNWISNLRFRRCVSRLYRQCDAVIALTSHDLPGNLPASVPRTVLPPLLKQSDVRWKYQGSRRVLFVGNVGYFANRLAVNWICGQLAPALLAIDPGVCIDIIGAGAEDVPRKWRSANVNFLGKADQDQVLRCMASDDLLIAPTAQDYGAKLKLAECASHGMPFIATESAMGGLPFLSSLPRIDLAEPAAAARLVLRYLNSADLLLELGRKIGELTEQARKEQRAQLRSFVSGLLATRSTPMSRIDRYANELPERTASIQ